MHASLLLAALAAIAPSVAAPTKTNVLQPRASQCGQYESISTGAFVLYTDLWGEAAGSGGQCSSVSSAGGSSISWTTSWSWSGGAYNVKSYTNAVVDYSSKQLNAISSIPTSWKWTYSGSNIIADVSYDTFLSTSASGSNKYEVMVWLGALGGAGPISSSGSPIATPNIGGITWDLYSGPNGATTVYSFVASNKYESNYSGDLKAFYSYLEQYQGLSSSLYLLNIGAGTEPFTGSNAVLSSTYSLSVN